MAAENADAKIAGRPEDFILLQAELQRNLFKKKQMKEFYLYYDHRNNIYIAKVGMNIIAKNANIYAVIEKIEEYFAAREKQTERIQG